MSEEFRSFIEPWRYAKNSRFYQYGGIEALIDYIEINYSDEEVNFYNHTDNYDGGGVLFVSWIEDGKLRSEVFLWMV